MFEVDLSDLRAGLVVAGFIVLALVGCWVSDVVAAWYQDWRARK